MSKETSYRSGGGTSVGRGPSSEVPETDTTTSPDGNDDGATMQELAAASGFNAPLSPTTSIRDAEGSTTNAVSEISLRTSSTSHAAFSASRSHAAAQSEAERSDEAQARWRSIHTTPGAFHVRPRRATDADDEDNHNSLTDDEETTADQSVNTSGAAVLPEVGAAAVVEAQVEAVAVQVDEAVATYQAVPVVDALATSRIPEDGEESSYQLGSGNTQAASLEEGGAHGSHVSGMSFWPSMTGSRCDAPRADPSAQHYHSVPAGGSRGSKDDQRSGSNKYAIGAFAFLFLMAVAVGLGLGLARPQDAGTDSSSTTAPQSDGEGQVQESNTTFTADNGTGEKINHDKSSYRLIEMEITPGTIAASVGPISSSLYLGLLLPTQSPGTMSRSLIVGWGMDDGVVKVYRSRMIKGNESISFEPFIESASIPLSDIDGGKVTAGEQDGSGQEIDGVRESSSIIVDGGTDGESFALSYRNCVRFYTSLFHENSRTFIFEKEGFDTNLINPDALKKTNSSDGLTSARWYQRGRTLVGDDDPTIQGFGTSIGYSPTGLHLFHRLVVGSDSGHVRAYRYRWTSDTVPKWQRLDGGLLDPPTNATGKAVVAIAGSGMRFAVGYPTLGKLSLYRFKDELAIDEDSGSSHIELVDEVYSESGIEGDMFGRSLSLDIYANFLIVGAKGYARAYWLRPTPSSLIGFEIHPVGGNILGEESDGDDFGTVVTCGRVPLHNGGCAACPFILDKQRVAISSPGYDDGRGRVILYQYNKGEEIWETLASPVEGKTNSDRVAHAVRLSPDMGSVAVTSAVGEARAFRLLALQ